MRLAALVSGGKDGMFAAHLARTAGHEIACILTAEPDSAESKLCHHPNTRHVSLQAESMRVPQIRAPAASGGEAGAITESLAAAKEEHSVEGVVHGGILSGYQRAEFAGIAGRAGLQVLAPLWGAVQADYMRTLLASRFRFIMASVSADGLGESWLGREIDHGALDEILSRAERFGFNPSFEGGEAETFVLDCPLFERPIEVLRARVEWDGYRGTFEIEEARLGARARLAKDRTARGDKKNSLL